MTNGSRRIAATAIALALAIGTSAGPAGAQANNCTWNGQEFAEGMDVCQDGLRQRCMNGEWQNLNGERCGGDQAEAAERLRVLEQEQADVEEE